MRQRVAFGEHALEFAFAPAAMKRGAMQLRQARRVTRTIEASSDSYGKSAVSFAAWSSIFPTSALANRSCANRLNVAICRPRAGAPPGGMYVV